MYICLYTYTHTHTTNYNSLTIVTTCNARLAQGCRTSTARHLDAGIMELINCQHECIID